MMLSVLIVNYRVRFFVEHCLLSVLAAVEHMQPGKNGWDAEILVIDNDPAEGSLEFLRPRFPSVRFFEAPENLGFGKANNFLLARAAGKYVLFLNPDTIIPEHIFTHQLAFLESNQAVAACGTRMIDGSGGFLPESKRGFPGTWNSFSKMSGLTALFPSSRIFAGYYLGHLDQHASQMVPILSGAYMLVRSAALTKTGVFDEQFFMYAEDIDLSYRFTKAGYQNYYFADTTVLHFKGESTRRDLHYTKQFYLAMIQFVRKHFNGRGKAVFIRLLEMAIRVKATISAPAQAGPGQVAASTAGQLTRTFFGGDPAAIALCRQRYQQLILADSEKTASQAVFCIGKSFSYVDLISSMETSEAAMKKIFHSNAMAIIGSNSKSSQGTAETIPE